MDLRKLRHFIVLAEELNFSRAAEKVHLTQSALSRSIISLEETLGARLFDRSISNVLLTPIGKILLKRAQSLLLDLGSIKQEVRLMAEGEIGDIVMGIGPFVGSILMPPILAEHVREKPLVRVDVEINTPEHLLEHLLYEQIDFFVADQLSIPPETHITVRPIARLHVGFFVRVGHPLSLKQDFTPPDILDYPLVSIRMNSFRRNAIKEYLGLTTEQELRQSVICDNSATLEFVTLNSNAVALVASTSGCREIEEVNLIELPTSKTFAFNSELAVVSLKGRTLSPSALCLIEKIREQALKFGNRPTLEMHT